MKMSSNEEAIKKAIEVGIAPEQIAADLADDGVLNNSNITGILHKEKDMLDLAQEKAEKLKALILTIIPILALLTGAVMEISGMTNMTDFDDEEVEEEPVVWGCTDAQASNFNYHATNDNGGCIYPPECNVFFYDDGLYWVDENETGLKVYADPDEDQDCGDAEIKLVFTLTGNTTYSETAEYTINGEVLDELWLIIDPIENGTYSPTLTLFYWKDNWEEVESKTYEDVIIDG